MPPLAELQKDFCLFKLGGKVLIGERANISALIRGEPGVELEMYSRPDGNLLLERRLEELPVSCDARQTLREFQRSPNTTLYDRIDFTPLPTGPKTLNLWVPSPAQPVQGDWLIVRRFLLEVICDGDIGVFRYLILFLAHMLQRPGEKPGIIIALIGGQGTGKGTFFQILKAIWPSTTLIVSDATHVVEGFNAALGRAYGVCMDEALFAGDRRALDRLKAFVTEPTITIEPKYQPRRTISSFHRFFAASNHQHFASVETDDRRFLFLQVSDAKKGDYTYWRQLHDALADPSTISAMVYDLARYPIVKYEVRARPKTQAHLDQKLKSLSGFDRYWLEVLSTGSFGRTVLVEPAEPWAQGCFIATEALMDGWRAYETGQRQFQPRQERQIAERLASLCPSAKANRTTLVGRQRRGFCLPPLEQAREQFEAYVGGKPEWPD
jgi:hypothetical protein